MRNIASINLAKDSYELGYTNEGNNANEIILNIVSNYLENPYIEITKQDNSIENIEVQNGTNIEYQLPISYFYGSGTLKVRIIADDYSSDYINFNILNDLTDENNIFLKKENNEYNVKKVANYKYHDLPIATKNSLGAIIVGNNLNIDSNGVLSAIASEEGTTDYKELINKPKINGVELEDDKSTTDLGISYTDLTNKPTNVSTFSNDAGYITEVQTLTNLEIESLLQ